MVRGVLKRFILGSPDFKEIRTGELFDMGASRVEKWGGKDSRDSYQGKNTGLFTEGRRRGCIDISLVEGRKEGTEHIRGRKKNNGHSILPRKGKLALTLPIGDTSGTRQRKPQKKKSL